MTHLVDNRNRLPEDYFLQMKLEDDLHLPVEIQTVNQGKTEKT